MTTNGQPFLLILLYVQYVLEHHLQFWVPKLASRQNHPSSHPGLAKLFEAGVISHCGLPRLLSTVAGWCYTYPSEKYEFVNWDDYSQYMEKYVMFQTTHQVELF